MTLVGADVKTQTGDIGNNPKGNTTTSDTLSPHDNSSTSVGSGNNSGNVTTTTTNTTVNSGTNSGNTVIDDHSNRDDHSTAQNGLFNIRIEGTAPHADSHDDAQAAHDSASHGGAAAHHGGQHPDPTVLALQEQLLANGFNPGPLDGIMGPQTEAALAEQQAVYAHQRHGGCGEHEGYYQGEHRANGYEHGGYGHEGYQHGGYGYPYDGYEHAGYAHAGHHHGYVEHEYPHADYVEVMEERAQAYHPEAYADEAYAMEGAEAAW